MEDDMQPAIQGTEVGSITADNEVDEGTSG